MYFRDGQQSFEHKDKSLMKGGLFSNFMNTLTEHVNIITANYEEIATIDDYDHYVHHADSI